MSVQMILAVAAGGACGAVGRFLVMSGAGHWLGHGFPYATLIVNIVGSFALGALLEISALVWSPPEELRAFLVVGCLGAFTTFSTFSMDTMALWTRGELVSAGLYVSVSVILSIAAFISGMAMFRAILA